MRPALDDGLDPATLMCAGDRAGRRRRRADGPVPEPDSVRVVSLLSWRYGNPALVVAEQLGLTAARDCA